MLRYRLIGVADQMTVALSRSAFSPIIYDRLDFACAIYDRSRHLLAQGRSMPLFLGTLGFCIEAVVEAVGGEERLEPGDVLFTTYSYHHGTHTNDATVVVPCFLRGRLLGYSVVKAHLADLGAKDAFCIDSVDIFQEGVIFPGVKFYRAGTRDEQVYRTLLANTRAPASVAGDLAAMVGAASRGAEALGAIVAADGLERSEELVARMHGQGEARTRDYYASFGDGTFEAEGGFDKDGASGDEVRFPVSITLDRGSITVSLAGAPAQQAAPANTPWQSTVGAVRFALLALVRVGESLNEGHFRPITVRTEPGTIFHPLPPAPVMMYSGPLVQLVDTIHLALARARPEAVPAGPAGELGGGMTLSGIPGSPRGYWIFSAGQSNVGQGADQRHDGANALSMPVIAGVRAPSVEALEMRYPVLFEERALARDSGGAGKQRGGLGIDAKIRVLEETNVIVRLARTRRPSWGLLGGGSGRRTEVVIHRPDQPAALRRGRLTTTLPAQSLIEVSTGGGGGYGEASERDPADVRADLREGYESEGHARAHYPQAFDTNTAR